MDNFLSTAFRSFPITKPPSPTFSTLLHHLCTNPHHTFSSQSFNGHITHLLHLLPTTPSLTKPLHALTITISTRVPQPIFARNVIILSYARSGELSLARKLFDEMPERNAVSYNTMIGAYGRDGNENEAWRLFYDMRAFGFKPTEFTYTGLLSCACSDLTSGSYLQALVKKSGFFYSDAYIGTALLGMYGRNGCLGEAYSIFEDMPEKNSVTWNAMISLFGDHGFAQQSMIMFRELIWIGGGLSKSSFLGVLSGFASDQDIELGEQVHGLLIRNGLCHNVEVANALINMYNKCSGAQMGEKMFVDGLVRDIGSWNTIIGAFSKCDTPLKGIELFLTMCRDGVLPNQATFASVISSCTSLQNLMIGKFIHAKIIKCLFDSNVYVGSSLIDFYGKLNELEDAHCCFDDVDEKNVVCWNALISSYSKKRSSFAVLLLKVMIRSGCDPNESSFSAVLKSATTLQLIQLHSLIVKMGYLQNEYVYCSLITSYSMNELISDALILVPSNEVTLPVIPCNIIAGIYNRVRQYHKAQELYTVLEKPDLVSWNILMAACARNGDYKEAFDLFWHMQMAFIYPDKYTYVSLLSVCTKISNLALGSSLHGLIIKTNHSVCDSFVYNIMINMYGKCGSLISSVKIFDEIAEKDVISWTTLVSVLGLHGQAEAALRKFREMEMVGFKLDEVALLAVLSACRHGGLVREGKELFGKMEMNYGIKPKMDHYHIIVDLLTRCGLLKEAEQLILSMPFLPNARIWRCFLEGCKRQNNTAEALTIEDMKLESTG